MFLSVGPLRVPGWGPGAPVGSLRRGPPGPEPGSPDAAEGDARQLCGAGLTEMLRHTRRRAMTKPLRLTISKFPPGVTEVVQP